MFSRRRLFFLVLVCLALVGGATALLLRPEPGFRVKSNRILDPDGDRFVVRGVVLAYGTFAGGPGGGVATSNGERYGRDIRRIRAGGGNLVRIMATPGAARGDRLALLRRIVAAARAENLVVQISSAFAEAVPSRRWITRLARIYRDDPYVWLQPQNEPGCAPGTDAQASACGDWRRWQRDHRAAIAAIREAGNTAPVVVNVPNFSTDLRLIDRYPLGDANVVYGAHRYGNDNPAFTLQEQAAVLAAVGGPSQRHAVIVDEFGNWNGSQFPNALAWSNGMARWIADWVRRGDGQGATGFNWRWSDPNSMLGADDRLTAWGKIVASHVLHSSPPRVR
jgi:hypothetical protein